MTTEEAIAAESSPHLSAKNKIHGRFRYEIEETIFDGSQKKDSLYVECYICNQCILELNPDSVIIVELNRHALDSYTITSFEYHEYQFGNKLVHRHACNSLIVNKILDHEASERRLLLDPDPNDWILDSKVIN